MGDLMPIVIRGILQKYELPTSPQWKRVDVDSCVRTFSGPYAALLAAMPRKDETMSDMPADMYVSEVTCDRKPAGQAIMTISLTGSMVTGYTAWPLRRTVEVDWITVSKPLRTHPRYNSGGAKPIPTPGAGSVYKTGWEAVDAWERETDYAARSNYGILDVSGTTLFGANMGWLLGDNEKDFAQLRYRGTESYNLYAPIIRITSTYAGEPNPGRAGQVIQPVAGTPTVIPNVSSSINIPRWADGPPIVDYAWMKTASKKTQNADRTWQVLEEWTGADGIESRIYPVPAVAYVPLSGKASLPAGIKKKALRK